MILAQTPTAVPITGNATLDWLLSLVTALSAFLAIGAVVVQTLRDRISVLRSRVADLVVTIRAAVHGVEVSREDILDVLKRRFPRGADDLGDITDEDLGAIADEIHDRVTGRIERTSNEARTEPVLAPIVTQVQAEIRNGLS